MLSLIHYVEYPSPNLALLLVFVLLICFIVSRLSSRKPTDIGELQEKLKASNQQLKSVQKELQNAQAESKKLDKDLKTAQKTTTTLQSERSFLQKELIELEKNKQALIEELSGPSGETEQELLTWIWVITKVKAAVMDRDRARTKRDEVIQQNSAFKEQLTKLNHKLREQTDEFKRKEDELRNRLQTSKSENKNLLYTLEELQQTIENLQEKLLIIQQKQSETNCSESTHQPNVKPLQIDQDENINLQSEKITVQEQYSKAVEQLNYWTQDKENFRKELADCLVDGDKALIKQIDELETFVEYLEYRLEKLSYEFEKSDFFERLLEQAGSNLW